MLITYNVVLGGVARATGNSNKASVFLSIKGQKQGVIPGEVAEKGKEKFW